VINQVLRLSLGLPNVKYRVENIAVREIVAHLLEELERLTRN
jgi:hypothetical protein